MSKCHINEIGCTANTYKCHICKNKVCSNCSMLIKDGECNRIVRACISCIEKDPNRFGFLNSKIAHQFWAAQNKLWGRGINDYDG